MVFLVPAWLRTCNDSIVELLYALDVGSYDGKLAKDTLSVFFKGLPYKELVDNFKFLDENKLIPFEKLTVETAVYWRNLTSFLLSEGGGAVDFLEALLPELTAFSQYIRHFVLGIDRSGDDAEVPSWIFVAKQLIEMTSVFDLADEVCFLFL